ncbi:hypothetical protein GP2143_14076 [marine gamma proteobacterium HTCC2143]|jgi:FkbM family methyltransferase|uniref:Methyltransferase FkbM domain-containing protein n=1 Tax=marine gamma proteobacterium HTCC2143 TaxID=247633 RepID=A0Y8D5_9GAMM|nr:hypothetical protein GP2143_14076 [marine gamma proteobacterium HTCC2143]
MKLHKKIAKTFGYELIKRKKHPSSNTHLINLINEYKIDLVIDAGANVGQFGKMLRAAGYKEEIHSFEPISTTFIKLMEAIQPDPNWQAYPCALGEALGEIEVNIMEGSDLSSILPPNEFGKENYKHIKVLDTETVTVRTVENFLTEDIKDCAQRRIFLKMDTQGYDLNVFKGAGEKLDFIIGIESEISFMPIYEGMPHYLESLKVYEDAGFVITGLYPISRKNDMAVIEMDCMMLNKRHLL